MRRWYLSEVTQTPLQVCTREVFWEYWVTQRKVLWGNVWISLCVWQCHLIRFHKISIRFRFFFYPHNFSLRKWYLKFFWYFLISRMPTFNWCKIYCCYYFFSREKKKSAEKFESKIYLIIALERWCNSGFRKLSDKADTSDLFEFSLMLYV